jgi:E3 ubiquitin-protein ligase TRIP12
MPTMPTIDPVPTHTNGVHKPKVLKESRVLHKTPVTPPKAVATKGIFIDLDDGRRVIDAIGGACVTCIGGTHPKVVEAIQNAAAQVSCRSSVSLLRGLADSKAKTPSTNSL